MLEITEKSTINLENEDNKQMSSQKKIRSFQVSMPEHYHTYIKMLALMSGTNVSELLRHLVDPYVDLIKDVLIERGYTNQWGQIYVAQNEILEELKAEIKKDPEKFLNIMSEYGKERGIKFDFVNITKIYN